MKRSVTRLVPVGLGVWTSTALMCAVLLVASAHGTRAAGVVGTGTPASCTEAALDAAFMGGGPVTFNCGTVPVTITITAPITIAVGSRVPATSVDGGGLITISGGGSTQVLSNPGKAKLTLSNLTISGGSYIINPSAGGGAIANSGTLAVTNCTFSGNLDTSNWGGGAIFNSGRIGNVTGGKVTVTNSTFSGNSSGTEGGAITNFGTLAVDQQYLLRQ